MPPGKCRVPHDQNAYVDPALFSRAQEGLGAGFARTLGYFREDGRRALIAIEEAMRAASAAALVRPAHLLKGEALQFGARPLAELAEHIEETARRCVEQQEPPTELLADVVRLRPLLERTLALFDRHAGPATGRRPEFGRRMPIVPGYGQR